MRSRSLSYLTLGVVLAFGSVGCGDDDNAATPDSGTPSTPNGGKGGSSSGKAGNGGPSGKGGGSGSSGKAAGGSGGAGSGGKAAAGGKGGSGGTAAAETLCTKYGGTNAIGSVVKDKIVPKLGGDCRISAFFTELPEPQLKHLVDCLSIQTEELFGCDGVKYVNGKDREGVACRSMKTSHDGLGISTPDFDALMEDVVAGLQEAHVEQEDISTAAPALTGLKGDIVESTATTNTKEVCGDAGI